MRGAIDMIQLLRGRSAPDAAPAKPVPVFDEVTLGINSGAGFALVYDWTIVTFLSRLRR